ncbi:MAG: hypothetical protein IT325_12480, partial [Anaerolineae bacterium]|nr:hypothetical protein [Anaerolineae bacterium]
PDDRPGPAPAPTVIFEDLTLADALRYLFWRPVRTTRLLWTVLAYDAERAGDTPPVLDAPPPDDWPDEDEPPAPEPDIATAPFAEPRDPALWLRIGALLAAIPLALIGGTQLHAAAIDLVAHSAGRTNGAFLWFGLAAALVIGVEVYAGRERWLWRLRRGAAHPALEEDMSDAADTAEDEAVFHVRSVVIDTPAPASAMQRSRARTGWLQTHTPALALILAGLVFAGLGWQANVLRAADDTPLDVVLTLHGGVFWLLSVALWAAALLIDWPSWRWRTVVPRPRPARPWWRRPDGLLIAAALVAITALGAYFRLHDLDSTPPEMTSDHIEKLLDALRVSEGYTAVFFPNNGGREGFQMWLVAFIADTLRVGFNFRALKLATALEGIITLPALWWMARQVIGTETPRARRLGQWVGLALAGLVAISSWHVMLSRLGLRIVLTPLTTALVIGFLARAMRHGRARDFVALGLMLGAGVYFYQANRMLPALAVIGAALAVLGSVRRGRDVLRTLADGLGLALMAGLPLAAYWLIASALEHGARDNLRQLGEQLELLLPLAAAAWLAVVALTARAWPNRPALRYGGGLLAAAVVALALYVPMYRYSALHPDEFWNRTRGRMFGDEAFWRVDPATGVATAYAPSPVEQIERVWEKRAVLAENYADALRMAHWEGDGAWINNAHSRPALDGLSGGLVILGLALWAVRLARRGDPVDWLIPAALLVMLLPSALTLAYTVENPSFTRASGVIPAVFLLAALPLGALGAGLTEAPRTRRGAWAGALGGLAAIGLVLALAIGPNWTHFFTGYRLSYNQSWKPYHAIAAPLKDFAQGEGSYGNAFMVAYPHWLDHRILGAVAGDLRWPNGLVTREDLPGRIAANEGTPYAYDPARPLFVMVHPQDAETIAYLENLLPGGTT